MEAALLMIKSDCAELTLSSLSAQLAVSTDWPSSAQQSGQRERERERERGELRSLTSSNTN